LKCTFHGPYRSLILVVTVTVYWVLFARLEVGSIVIVVALVVKEVVLATSGDMIIFVLFKVGGLSPD
jgi:hypothetical protein